MKHVSIRSHQPTGLRSLSTAHEQPPSRALFRVSDSPPLTKYWFLDSPGSTPPRCPQEVTTVSVLLASLHCESSCFGTVDCIFVCLSEVSLGICTHSYRFCSHLQCHHPTEDGDVCVPVSALLGTNEYLRGGQTNSNLKQSTPQAPVRSCLLTTHGKCPLLLTGLRFSTMIHLFPLHLAVF